MRIFANNTVVAKSRFWYFLMKLRKVKKSNGEIVALNQIHEKRPSQSQELRYLAPIRLEIWHTQHVQRVSGDEQNSCCRGDVPGYGRTAPSEVQECSRMFTPQHVAGLETTRGPQSEKKLANTGIRSSKSSKSLIPTSSSVLTSSNSSRKISNSLSLTVTQRPKRCFRPSDPVRLLRVAMAWRVALPACCRQRTNCPCSARWKTRRPRCVRHARHCVELRVIAIAA